MELFNAGLLFKLSEKQKGVFKREGGLLLHLVCVSVSTLCLQSITICSVWYGMFVVYSAHQTLFLL